MSEEDEMSDGVGEEEGEEGEDGEGEETQDTPLTMEAAGQALSLLCKTGTGLAHAYVRMDLRDRGLTDISQIERFVHIRYLDVSGNHLEALSALNALPQLLTIKADHNRLTSARLEKMQYLQSANFSHNRIASTDGIAHPLLETLILSNNKISELTGLTANDLPCLRHLDLSANPLASTAGLSLPSLLRLYLASCSLSRLEGLEGLRQLTTLHARDNQLTSLEGFAASMEALQYFNVRGNDVAELSELKHLQPLPFLRALVLAECPLVEADEYRVEVLVVLPKLERLDKDSFTEDEREEAEELSKQRREEAEQ